MTQPRGISGRVTGRSDPTPGCCGCGWRSARPARWHLAAGPVPADQGHRAAADGGAARGADHDGLGAFGERAGSASTTHHDGAAAAAHRAGHHRGRAGVAAPGDRRRLVRGGGLHRGLRAPVRPTRNGAGHGHLHVVLLLAVSAGEVRRAAVADRRRQSWARSAASCGAPSSCPTGRKAFCARAFGHCGRGWRSSSTPPRTPCESATPTSGDSADCESGPAGSTRPR